MSGRVGIDVGGTRKGFHVAIVRNGDCEVSALFHAGTPREILQWLEEQALSPDVIAIDCPPRCSRRHPQTRLAERQLHRLGYRMQWTRHERQEPAEWMQNGQRLWETLRECLPHTVLIECFPTAVGDSLGGTRLTLPLRLLAPYHKRREWKDFVDACICADVATRYEQDVRSAGLDDGESDELGPIYF